MNIESHLLICSVIDLICLFWSFESYKQTFNRVVYVTNRLKCNLTY